VCSDDGKLNTHPPILVTASVDAIELRKRLEVERDMSMGGQVVWTGTSSMDIRMELLQASSVPTKSCQWSPEHSGLAAYPCFCVQYKLA
jgi:hypothetical protein